MDTRNLSEKRNFSRVKVPGLRVSFKLLDPRTWSTYHEKSLNMVENISLGGLAIKTNNELIVKAPVGIDIKISPDQDPIRTFGRVAWIRKEDGDNDNYLMGISFSWWKKEEDKKILRNIMEKN